ncbi:MAG: alpha-hydroxy-acid oxidizing protein, partial [Rhodospirillales bacterium]|nr:alpha-hydroxy-acid oxidizing protein [Rhodospirillales bacterium]
MDIDQRYPCVEDMKEGARRRVPRFAYDYLVGGIGKGDCLQRNRQDLDDTLLMPRYLIDASKPDFRCNVLGKTYDAPFGVAPIGLSGLIWRGSEKMLATAAKKHNIPYILSTFANESLERIRPVGGENAWFQFYPPNNRAMEDDIIKRTRNAGYEVMVVTIDIPVGTRRDHDIRNGLSIPPKIGLNTIRQCAARPTWSLQALIHGIPDFENMSPYYGAGATLEQSAQFVTNTMTGHITAERIKRIRDV